MRFEEPLWFLWTLPVLAAAAYAWHFLEGRRPALLFPGADRLKDLSPRLGRFWVRRGPTMLKTAVLLLGVAAMARPQTISRQQAGLTEGIDILLVLDTSMSMLAEDFEPNRMGAAVAAARDFISGRTTDRIGILVFGSAPLLTSPLTLDHAALQEFLDDVEAGMIDQKGTAIGDGVAAAVSHLRESASKSKVIILLTDGSSNTGLLDPLTAAKLAKTYDIKIYAIGTAKRGVAFATVHDPRYGTRRFQIRDDLDEDTLLQIAAETGGRYFRATNSAQLTEIYSDIDELEKYEFDKPEFISFTDQHGLLLIPALLLLALEMLLSNTLLLRIP